jgi:hypothetical protein
MFLFGLCNIITTWCAGFTVYLTVPHNVAGWKDFPACVETIPRLAVELGKLISNMYFLMLQIIQGK